MEMYSIENISSLIEQFKDKSPETMLNYFMGKFGHRLALSSSLSIEDQTITDMMLKIDRNARIFTLDTGRLFPETYQLIDKTNKKYDIKMEIFCPQANLLQDFVREYGINPFYESIEKRHHCCEVRKLEPLSRAFDTVDVWVCGLRKSQSITRTDMQMIEWDEQHAKLKLNPLINWTEEQVWEYVKEKHVPYNELYKKGFPSIGCEPCTRAVKQGEDIRSGRWWWEDPNHRECGLHRK